MGNVEHHLALNGSRRGGLVQITFSKETGLMERAEGCIWQVWRIIIIYGALIQALTVYAWLQGPVLLSEEKSSSYRETRKTVANESLTYLSMGSCFDMESLYKPLEGRYSNCGEEAGRGVLPS